MFERIRAAQVSSHWGRLAVFSFVTFAASSSPASAEPREGYSKVTIANRYLFAQPNASSPAPILLNGLDADIVEEYEDWTLARVHRGSVDTLRSRSIEPAVEVRVHDDYDWIYAGGRLVDARLGVARSLPSEKLDLPYVADESGAWIVQFHGPIKPQWLGSIESEKATAVQYLPHNAFIVGARASAIDRISRLPFVQFVTQLHTFMKPTFRPAPGTTRELWIQLATTEETPSAITLLEKLSIAGVRSAAWSAVETRVEGTFRADDVETVLREPLVTSVSERPTISMSDERVGISLTNLDPAVSGKKYKKWLADLCEACSNLQGDGHYIGIADLGLDGGSHAATAQIYGEPNASGFHRPDLNASRIIYGSSFEDVTGQWAPGNFQTPDSTTTRHDVHGHGSLVAGIAAGDPGVGGPADTGGFLWGLGVAPTAGVLITKINATKVATGETPIRRVTRDAWSHPVQQAFIQNHSYNQYNGVHLQSCDYYYDGYYSALSRDFDRAVRDADDEMPGDQQILLTIAAGNVSQQAYANDTACHPRRYLTLPPATAKNVLSMGMAESVRPDSGSWNCQGALATSYGNIAGNSKTGTATPGWHKPDLMAVASNVASIRSHDLDTGSFSDDFCRSGAIAPTVPAEYLPSTGTSFAAPVAAGAAALASRSYAAMSGGNPGSASPALLKAMLIAGSKSMAGGLDRSRTHAWRPSRAYRENELAVPRNPDGRVYRATTGSLGGMTGGTEPHWPGGGGNVQDNQITWIDDGPEPLVAGFPNDRQGFGRIHLEDVLSSYPARQYVNQDAQPNSKISSGQSWSRSYRVHDATLPVRVALVWTDAPAEVNGVSFILTPPLVNDLDLSVELGVPCTEGRYVGNDLDASEVSELRGCTAGTFDTLNNVEVARFFVTDQATPFTVRVTASQATNQDFALVVYNAYPDGVAAPPATPSNFTAAAESTTSVRIRWNPVFGATDYQLQRSAGAGDAFSTLDAALVGDNYLDTSVTSGQTYLYRVRARNGTAYSDYSIVDPATTVIFLDDPLSAGSTVIRAVHMSQLREAADAMRTAALLPAYSWTDAAIIVGATVIKANHIVDLRLAIDPARAALGLSSRNAYTDGALTAGVTPVRAIHIEELRERLR